MVFFMDYLSSGIDPPNLATTHKCCATLERSSLLANLRSNHGPQLFELDY